MRLQHFRKTLIFLSFMLFSFTFMFMSPYLAVLGSAKGVVTCGLLFWGLFFVTSPVLGRAGCGYLCPLGGLQDCVHSGLERPLVGSKHIRIIKYALWGFWIFGIGAAARAGGGWRRFDLLFPAHTAFPPYDFGAYIALLGFLLLTAIPAILMGRRAFCHHLCFFSPLNIIGSKLGRAIRLPALRVKVTDRSACKSCKLCNRECPMSLDVVALVHQGAVEHTECIACGNCSAACRFGALSYGFSRPDRI